MSLRGAKGSPHAAPLQGLGFSPDVTHSLGCYLDVLATWSPRANLTAARTPGDRVRLLVAEVTPVAGALGFRSRMIDVGSGNGSPGLVLALLRPDLEVTLLEPRLKRWAFLREACRVLGRGDVSVRRERHDQYTGPVAATVTLRALALPMSTLKPLVGPGGCLIVLGGEPVEQPPFRLESRLPLPHSTAHVFRECST
jgi:16S rRNA (guanine(527)-N(7))-methyltransferase RsmG